MCFVLPITTLQGSFSDFSYLCNMIKTLHLIIYILVNLPLLSVAQNPLITYPAEGVYTSFSAFRNGNPDILKSQFVKPVSDADYTIRQWVNSDKMSYHDSADAPQNFDPRQFWGLVEKGTLYIFLGNKFHKINTLGSISYFLESYPVIKGNMAPVVTEARSTSAYRFMDMETGEILDYNVENLLTLLEKDEPLHLEYKSILSQKEKKKKMFIYMEKFNIKHPLSREIL